MRLVLLQRMFDALGKPLGNMKAGRVSHSPS
jgi:hypothetical protein